MKNFNKILSFCMFLLLFIFFTSQKVNATDISDNADSYNALVYYIRDVNLNTSNGNLTISGYAYHQRYINYTASNHRYRLIYQDTTNNANYYSDWSNPIAQPENLTKILEWNGASYGYCNDEEDHSTRETCSRRMDYAGFSITKSVNDLVQGHDYLIWIQIEETYGGSKHYYEARVYMPFHLEQKEYKNTVYSIESSLATGRVVMIGGSVAVRADAGKSSEKMHAGGLAPVAYWTQWKEDGYEVYNHISEIKNTTNEGYWVKMGWTWPDNGRKKGGHPLVYNGASNYGYSSWSFIKFISSNSDFTSPGSQLTLHSERKTYVGNMKVETKTAPVGENSLIRVGITNSKSDNEAKIQIFLDGSNSASYDSGWTTWSGDKAFNYTLAATGGDRSVKVVVTERANNYKTTMNSTLYAASNKKYTVSDLSGQITPNTPIYYIKYQNGSENKYYETIKYNQGAINYELDNSNDLTRTLTFNYTTNYAGISNWYKSRITADNYISSPSETYSLTKTTNNDAKVVFSNTKAIKFIDLNNKSMKSTAYGIGANNITIELKANYKFIDASQITLIDTRTHDKKANGEAYITINNSKNRKVHYKIYFGTNLLLDKTETWNGDKNITINPVITDVGEIRVQIIQPNTITENLKGAVYYATNETIEMYQDGSYTSPTPIRVKTSQDLNNNVSVKKYYETLNITSLDKNPVIKAGEGFESKIKIDYSTTDDIYDLSTSIITSDSSFGQKEDALDYEEQQNGTFTVRNDKTGVTTKSITTTLPEVVVDKKTGTIYRPGMAPDGVVTINGGHKWYTSMEAVEGNYEFNTTLQLVGINKITFKIYNQYNISGSLIGNTDSKYKVIRVKNPENPNYTWHKTYSMQELIESFSE